MGLRTRVKAEEVGDGTPGVGVEWRVRSTEVFPCPSGARDLLVEFHAGDVPEGGWRRGRTGGPERRGPTVPQEQTGGYEVPVRIPRLPDSCVPPTSTGLRLPVTGGDRGLYWCAPTT